MTDLVQKLTRNIELNDYLKQLEELVGHDINQDNLSSISEIYQLKDAATQLSKLPTQRMTIPPEELKSSNFRSFILRIKERNPSPVSIWTSATPACGTYYAPDISDINFDFDFEAFPEGIISLMTTDGQDRIILDFSPEEVEIEIQGKSWPNAEN